MSAEPVVVDVDGVGVRREHSLLTMESAPREVIAEAQEAARALHAVLANKPRKVVMNDKQYLEFEDWQTVGRFYGITARGDGDPELVEMTDAEGGLVRGFKASAVAVNRLGQAVSRATAFCLSDEEKWSSKPKYAWVYVLKSGGTSEEDPGKDEIVWEPNPAKPGKNRPQRVRQLVGTERVPLFQLASMAQTRANAKALRNVLAWVAVLAGYGTTPAEELADVAPPADADEPAPARTAPAPRQAAAEEWPNDTTAHERHGVEPARPAAPPAGGLPPCPQGHSGNRVMLSKVPKNGAYYCKACSKGYGPVEVRG